MKQSDIEIYPPYWFSGMADCVLQLLVHAEDVAHSTFRTSLPHVDIERVALSSPNYLLVNITFPDGLTAGEYDIFIDDLRIPYTLRRKRPWRPVSDTIDSRDTVYLMMPDRFAKAGTALGSDIDRNAPCGWHGGNLRGIAEKSAYLTSLGVTAAWITPYVANRMPPTGTDMQYTSYHGYSATDSYAVDPHFGDINDARLMNEALHSKGIKVIMDYVLNHVGTQHMFVTDPPSDEWINHTSADSHLNTNYMVSTRLDPHAAASDLRATVEGWFTDNMADVNLDNTQVLRYFVQNALWWIETVIIDALRIDTFPYVDSTAMNSWLSSISREYPGLTIIAEAWNTHAAYTGRLQRDVTSSVPKCSFVVMDFAMQQAMTDAMIRRDPQLIYDHFSLDFVYRDPCKVMAFLDNHDLQRWYSTVPDERLAKVATAILLTSQRLPQIYYGTELLMDSHPHPDNDGYKRKDFPEGFASITPVTGELAPSPTTRKRFRRFMSTLLKWRKEHPDLMTGPMIHYIPQGCDAYIFFRHSSDRHDTLLVASNLSDKRAAIDLTRYADDLGNSSHAIDIISKKRVDLSDGRLLLQPESVRLLHLI